MFSFVQVVISQNELKLLGSVEKMNHLYTLFDMGFFEPSAFRGMIALFVVITPVMMKFATGIKLDVFYTVVTKHFVTSLLLRNYDVIILILANA